MKVPGKNGEAVRIIAQSQLDVNQEIIEGRSSCWLEPGQDGLL
jgi:hypothetical protein